MEPERNLLKSRATGTEPGPVLRHGGAAARDLRTSGEVKPFIGLQVPENSFKQRLDAIWCDFNYGIVMTLPVAIPTHIRRLTQNMKHEQKLNLDAGYLDLGKYLKLDASANLSILSYLLSALLISKFTYGGVLGWACLATNIVSLVFEGRRFRAGKSPWEK